MSQLAIRIEEEMAGIDEADLRRALAQTLKLEKADLSLSLVVVDDAKIWRLNRQFLNHDYPTDVISFDLRSDGPEIADAEESEADEVFDAEIVVSATTATREAIARDLDPRSELLLYCIHGTLHLLGYDDHEEDDHRRMHQRQAEILQSLGYETRS